MDTIWVVSSTTLLVFCLVIAFKLGKRKGYKKGATDVLNEWKRYMALDEQTYLDNQEETKNDKNYN